MGIINREGALYMATGVDNTGLYAGRREAIGIIKAMTSQITSFDVFGGIGISAAMAFANAAKSSYDFEKEFRKNMLEVATISTQVSGSMTDFMNRVLSITQQIPVTAPEAAKALYQIVSAGHDGADGMKILEVSAKSAVGGLTETATAADAITTILNAYKLSADQAANISDQLFTTVRLGKTDFSQLGTSIAQVAPIAAAYGIGIDEVLGAVASLTKQGVPTSQAMTQIRAAIQGASKELGDAAFQGRTFQEALQLISEQAGGSASKIKEMLGTDEGLAATLALTGKNAKSAASDLTELQKSAGATEAAFQKMRGEIGNQMKMLSSNIHAILRPMGEGILRNIAEATRIINEGFESGKIETSLETLKKLLVGVSGTFLTYKAAMNMSSNQQAAESAITTVLNNLKILQNKITGESIIAKEKERVYQEAYISTLEKTITQEERAKLAKLNLKSGSAEYSKTLSELALQEKKNAESLVDSLTKQINKNKEKLVVAQENLEASRQAIEASKKEFDIAFEANDLAGVEAAQAKLNAAAKREEAEANKVATTSQKINRQQKQLTVATTQAETTATRINTATTKADAAVKGIATTATNKLKVATSALFAVMRANPIGAILTLVSLLVTLYITFADKIKKAETAQEKLNKEYEKAIQRKQELVSKTDSLIAKINSETESIYSQIKAYKELVELFPELKGMTFEEFKAMPQSRQKSMLNNIVDKKELEDAIKAYSNSLKMVEALEKKVKDGNDQYNNWLEDERLLLKGRKDRLEEIKQLQWEANTPVEKKVEHYQHILSSLQKQRDELNEQLHPVKVMADYTGDIAGAWAQMPTIIDQIKLDNLNNQINQTSQKINSLTGKGDGSMLIVTKDKAHWEEQKKSAVSALEAIDSRVQAMLNAGNKKGAKAFLISDLKKTEEEAKEVIKTYTDSIAKLNEANKNLKLYDFSDKAKSDLLKAQSELSHLILDSELKLQSERIAAMTDGKNKRIALVEQEYKETVAVIQKEKEEYQKKIKETKGTVDPAVLSTFDDRKAAAREKKTTDTAQIEKEYAEEYKQRTKALTDVFLSEEKKRLSAIKERYDEERRWANEQLKTGGLSKSEYAEYTTNIDKAEKQEMYQALLSDLDDYKQKEKDLREKWDTDIQAAVEAKDAYLVARLMEGKQKALSALNAQMLQESEEWQQLFGNLDDLTADQLQKLIATIKAKAKDLKLNPVDLKVVMDNLQEVENKIRTINPFKSLSQAIRDYKKAEDDAVKQSSLKDIFLGIASSVDLVKGSFDSIVGGLNEMGLAGDEMTQQLLGDISKLMGSASELVTGIATGNPLSIIQGGIGLLSSAFNIFSGDRRHEKKIQRIQEQVDALDRAYDKLGDSIEKAYSKDASELIGQQNEMLEQQKVLIQQQIREEEEKKKTDKDRIKEWQNQLEDIDRVIADNKEKAKDAIFGEDLKSSIDSFADAYAEAWAAGEDRAKSMKDVARSMIRQTVIELIKSSEGLGETVKKIREMIIGYLEDGVIDEWEQKQIDDYIESETSRLDSKYEWADKYLQGDKSIDIGISSDSLSDTILEGLQAGKSGIKDFSSSFEDMMKTAVLNSLKLKYLEGPLKEFQKKFTELSESGGQLTEAEIEELRAMYAEIIDGAKVQFDSMKEISGLDFSLDSDNTLKGAFAKASQESIDLLAGQTGAQRVAVESIREQLRIIFDLQREGWADVRAIRELTVKIDRNSEQVAKNTSKIQEVAGTISEFTRSTAESTKRAAECLDGTISVKVKM